MKKYTVNYFINKFSKIPANRWTTKRFKTKTGKCCALGHCGDTDLSDGNKESNALFRLISKNLTMSVYTVNDERIYVSRSPFGYVSTYLGDTPKSRILAALELIKAGVKL